MRRGQSRDEGTGLWGMRGGRGGSALKLEALAHFRGCYISQTHTSIVEMLPSAADRLCLCVSARACGKAMLSY